MPVFSWGLSIFFNILLAQLDFCTPLVPVVKLKAKTVVSHSTKKRVSVTLSCDESRRQPAAAGRLYRMTALHNTVLGRIVANLSAGGLFSPDEMFSLCCHLRSFVRHVGVSHPARTASQSGRSPAVAS